MKVLLVGEGASELAGALTTLVSRVSTAELEISLEKVSRAGIHVHHGKGRGYWKRAVRWMMHAKKGGYDALILVIDEDGRKERSIELAEAQDYLDVDIRRAFGVAIRTFDAWMLVDETALTKVLGFKVSRQPSPEDVRDPKSTFQSLYEDSNCEVAISESYAEVARLLDLWVLETRCSKGFGVFADRVRRI